MDIEVDEDGFEIDPELDDVEDDKSDAPVRVEDDVRATWDAMQADKAEKLPQDAPDKAPEVDAPAEGDAKGDRIRDAQGRFSAQTEPVSAENPNPLEAPAADTPTPDAAPDAPLGPPSSWSVAAKGDYAGLSDPVKQAISQRETEVAAGFSKFDGLRQLEQDIRPFADRAERQGITFAQKLDSMVRLEQIFDRDPIEGLRQIARDFDINLAALAGSTPRTEETFDNTALQQGLTGSIPESQELQSLRDQVAGINQRLKSDAEAQRSQMEASVQAEVDQFFSDPKNLYAENVRSQMGDLARANPSHSLSELYEQAIWLNPEIRAQLIQKQTADHEASEKAVREAAAAKARAASASVSGSSPAGASESSRASGGYGRNQNSYRQSVLETLDEMRAST